MEEAKCAHPRSLEVTLIVEVSLSGSNQRLVLSLGVQVDGSLSGQQSRLLDECKLVILAQLAKQVDEGLFVVVVGLNRDFVVGKGLAAVIVDLLGGDFTLSHVNLVSTEDDWDVGAHSADISMPVGDVFVGQTGSNIEHDDGGLASNIVALTKPCIDYPNGSERETRCGRVSEGKGCVEG